jgi:hypothetical protein
MVMTGYGANYLNLVARQAGRVGGRNLVDVSNPMDDPNAFIRSVGRLFGSYNLVPLADALDYGVAYPAAAAVAAPLADAGIMFALSHPEGIAVGGEMFNQFISPSGPIATWPAVTAFWINQFINRYVYPIGP